MQSMHLVVRAIQAHVLISKFWNSERRESCLDLENPGGGDRNPAVPTERNPAPAVQADAEENDSGKLAINKATMNLCPKT